MGDIIVLDRGDPRCEHRAGAKARLERLPYVNRVDAKKRLGLDVAEIDAHGGARGDKRALVQRLAVDQRTVDIPGDRAKEAHEATEL